MSALSALFSPFAIIIRLRSAIPSCPSCKRSPVFPPVWVFPSRCDCPSVLFVRLSLSLALRTNGRCNSNPRVLESNQTRNSIFVQLAYSLYGIRSTYLAGSRREKSSANASGFAYFSPAYLRMCWNLSRTNDVIFHTLECYLSRYMLSHTTHPDVPGSRWANNSDSYNFSPIIPFLESSTWTFTHRSFEQLKVART